MKRTVSLPIDPTQLREPTWLQVGDLVNVHGRPMMGQPERLPWVNHGLGIVVKLSRTGENSFAAQVLLSKRKSYMVSKLHWFDVSELSIVDSAQDSESG